MSSEPAGAGCSAAGAARHALPALRATTTRGVCRVFRSECRHEHRLTLSWEERNSTGRVSGVRDVAGQWRSGKDGGERGIRTPDTRKGMADFESAAFNRALPALRVRPVLNLAREIPCVNRLRAASSASELALTTAACRLPAKAPRASVEQRHARPLSSLTCFFVFTAD